jgi:hypothetical protein
MNLLDFSLVGEFRNKTGGGRRGEPAAEGAVVQQLSSYDSRGSSAEMEVIIFE